MRGVTVWLISPPQIYYILCITHHVTPLLSSSSTLPPSSFPSNSLVFRSSYSTLTVASSTLDCLHRYHKQVAHLIAPVVIARQSTKDDIILEVNDEEEEGGGGDDDDDDEGRSVVTMGGVASSGRGVMLFQGES